MWVQSPPELPFHFVGVDSSTKDERLDLLHSENSGPCRGGFIAISENDLDILGNQGKSAVKSMPCPQIILTGHIMWPVIFFFLTRSFFSSIICFMKIIHTTPYGEPTEIQKDEITRVWFPSENTIDKTISEISEKLNKTGLNCILEHFETKRCNVNWYERYVQNTNIFINFSKPCHIRPLGIDCTGIQIQMTDNSITEHEISVYPKVKYPHSEGEEYAAAPITTHMATDKYPDSDLITCAIDDTVKWFEKFTYMV